MKNGQILFFIVKSLVDILISAADFSLKNVRFPLFFIANTKVQHALKRYNLDFHKLAFFFGKASVNRFDKVIGQLLNVGLGTAFVIFAGFFVFDQFFDVA
ncbi:Uncharacterised protein [Moraxella equi]|uniref:Uncharacterized protein n=1 Tax=Moraxella equi TaxID=60442 RepID=A0A378QUT3_9GAMM|nr:Uncharacterised protein [Moraxella equi]